MAVVASMYCARIERQSQLRARNADQLGVEERKRESRLGGFVIAVEERRRSRGPRSGTETLRTWAVKEANTAAVRE